MTGPPVRVSAYYSAPVDRFLTTEPYQVLGALASAHSHDLEVEQRQAWEEELLILKRLSPHSPAPFSWSSTFPALGAVSMPC